jgi:signal transduction histidine kinase
MNQNTSEKIKILIVDDALLNLEYLKVLLTQNGYEVYGSENGTDALLDAVRYQPDLILLDIMMPDIDGYTVCQKLKEGERTRDIPVIFLSALSAAVDKVEAYALGGVDYITKPFQAEEVLVRINTHIKYRSNERILKDQVSTLIKSNTDLRAFTHTVAHDIKSPVSSILLGSEYILDRVNTPEFDSEIKSISNTVNMNARTVSKTIDEMLLLASMQREDVDCTPLDMAQIVNQVQKRLRWMIDEYKAEIQVPQSWPVAIGYGPWVEEVWINYLSNGLKYGGKPPVLHLGAYLEQPCLVRFWVRDNGLGIPQEKLGSLFTEFTRIRQVQIEGYGLGLSIVKRIVTKLGGDVAVESDMGNGSTFSFSLPEYSHASSM